jgi:hypothetical protein
MRHARVYELLLGQTSEYDLDHILCFCDAFCTDPKYDVKVALQGLNGRMLCSICLAQSLVRSTLLSIKVET